MAREHNNAQVQEGITELQKFMEMRRKNLSSLIDAVTQNQDETYSLRFPRFMRFRDDK
jgi:hypothetical protein